MVKGDWGSWGVLKIENELQEFQEFRSCILGVQEFRSSGVADNTFDYE